MDAVARSLTTYEKAKAVLDFLLEQGLDLTARDASGKTVLMIWDCPFENELAPMLIKTGADPTAKDPTGKSAEEYIAGTKARSDNNWPDE